MPDYRVDVMRHLDGEQTGVAYVEADSEEEARKLVEDDPDNHYIEWDDVDDDDLADGYCVEVKSVAPEDDGIERESEPAIEVLDSTGRTGP